MHTGHRVEIERISFSDLQTFPRLFSTYCEDYQRVSEYYAGNPFDDIDLKDAVHRAANVTRNLDTLADVLLAQNTKWGMDDATERNIELLRSGAVAVITGQQLGILGGPIYTQYKTITTIQLARKVAEISGHDVVPVFWLAGEDHDFEEVAKVRIRPELQLEIDTKAGTLGPVGRHPVDSSVKEVLDEAQASLENEPNGSDFPIRLRSFYEEGRSWTDAFAMYTRWLFQGTGLIVVSGDDPQLKQIGKSLFQKAATDFKTLNAEIDEASRRLEKEYHAQLSPRSTNLFYMTESSRTPIEPEGDGFGVKDVRHFSPVQLGDLIDQSPELISPNVVTRPLYQDLLFPTVAYVAGPGETSYFGQLKGAYEWADIPMPIIYPRVSVSIVEPNISRLLEKESIRIEDIDTNVERMFTARIKESLGDDLGDSFSDAQVNIDALLSGLASSVEEIDPTLKRTALSISSTVDKELSRLQTKLVRSQKRKREISRNRLLKIVGSLFPGGAPQERTVAAAYYLARFGSDFIAELLIDLPTETSSHVVVKL